MTKRIATPRTDEHQHIRVGLTPKQMETTRIKNFTNLTYDDIVEDELDYDISPSTAANHTQSARERVAQYPKAFKIMLRDIQMIYPEAQGREYIDLFQQYLDEFEFDDTL